MSTEVLNEKELAILVEKSATKLHWFMSSGYKPHYYQLLFHISRNEDTITRFRHLVSGRRGGKTLAAAWEILFYSLHPTEYHKDFHDLESKDPLWIWCLAKDYKLGRPSLLTFRKVIKEVNLLYDKEYKENKTEKFFEFENETLVEFKSANDPESLRGAGLDLLWIDEAAFIPNEDAWNVVSPSLSDKEGAALFTSTPKGRNWYHNSFFNDDMKKDKHSLRIEYRSIDSPYYKQEEWERNKRLYHPILFKQEFEASFDALVGIELSGEWLHYYTFKELLQEVGSQDGKANLKLYMGVDPAISLSSSADKFSMALIGITEDNVNAYLLETYSARIPFPEQIDVIKTWFHQYRPICIGVESQAYQAALAQQALRLEGLPPIIQILNSTKKSMRILGMAPLFKIGKIKIRREHFDFINEWVNYDSTVKNTADDCLDAVEIALRTAGALLPLPYEVPQHKKNSWLDIIKRDKELDIIGDKREYDPYLGAEI